MSSPNDRRSFFGALLSRIAGAWVAIGGLAGLTLASGCQATEKYGGPPPRDSSIDGMAPKYGVLARDAAPEVARKYGGPG